MGFLNNTTVTVDAILTKKGRELLAQGTEAFDITKFALADDEVDYNLFDVTHPNGSDSFGKVIENMPLLEAIPDENHVMRYKLITLPKTTRKMPIMSVSPSSGITFTQALAFNQGPEAVTANTANVSDSSYTFILHDQSVCSMFEREGAASSAGASEAFFLGEDEAPNSKTLVALSVNIGVGQGVDAAKATQLTIVGNDTGATKSITITNNVVNSFL
tara:strand:+ start:77 stop:727 length:651 start_codon:yes stop_codon:yes gene_type:complete